MNIPDKHVILQYGSMVFWWERKGLISKNYENYFLFMTYLPEIPRHNLSRHQFLTAYSVHTYISMDTILKINRFCFTIFLGFSTKNGTCVIVNVRPSVLSAS